MKRFKRSVLALIFALVPAFGAHAASAKDYSICIDPGHGGTDPGAMTKASAGCSIASLKVNGNLEEADVVLDTSKKLREYLLNAGFKAVFMTRDSDTSASLSERTSYANSKGCKALASIHANAGGGTGIETFCYNGLSLSSAGCVQAQKIQDEMIKQWPIRSRGRKQANFHMVRESKMQATLTELAFMDTCSPDVNSYLSVPAKRTSAALAHLYGLQAALGLTQGGGGTVSDGGSGGGGGGGGGNTTTTGSARGVLFEDVGVGTNDMSKRLSGAKVTVNGKTATTDSSGNWAFEGLAPGTYTLTGTMSGYNNGTKSCTVTAGGTAWCSFGLTKTQSQTSSTCELWGVVYDKAKSEAIGSTSDSSVRLPGASVENVQTGVGYALSSSGRFDFSVVKGQSYTIRASMGGYASAERTCTVECEGTCTREDKTTTVCSWCSFGLEKQADTVTTGSIKGIVYTNGSTSDLVSPATIKLNTGKTTSYAGASEWLFTDLAAGTYTVTVTADGYETATKSCPAVKAGEMSQCNVEVTKIATVDPDPVTPDPVDPDPVDPQPTDPDPVEPDPSEPSESLDPGDPENPLDPSDPSDPMTPEDGEVSEMMPQTITLTTSGCSGASGDATTGLGMFLIALGAFCLRRRPATGSAMVAMAALSLGLSACTVDARCVTGKCDGGDEPSAEQNVAPKALIAPTQEREIAEGDIVDARRVPAFVRADWIETIADGDDWTAPVFSPDGESIAFTKSKMKGLYLKEMTTRTKGVRASTRGEIKRLTDEDGAGFAPRFSRDGKRLAYRVPGQPFHAVPQQLITREGKAARPFHLTHQLWVLNPDDDTIVLRQGKKEKVIAASATDRFYRPFITPDSRWVIYNGLFTGVYGYRIADGKTVYFGPGSYASVSEDGRYLAFSVTEDDGMEITKGTLHIADLSDESPRVCAVELDAEIVLHPTISVLRSSVAFSGDGRIRMAPLRFDAP